ncbi:hypothetical protein N7G274_002327 [Stereocaulon virgatum]|uniref:Uncharacterized protein n=1 Tax=Stereocaulon virgatum TaxID=373712 RepID=A0ABR4AKN8_9LECA
MDSTPDFTVSGETPSTVSTPFLNLPREMRDAIYESVYKKGDPDKRIHVLPRVRNYYIVRGADFRYDIPIPETTLALLRVNRQVSAEVASNLYGRHTFVGRLNDLSTFLQGLRGCKALVKKVEVTSIFRVLTPGHIGLLPSVFDTLECLSNLTTLKVNAEANYPEGALTKPVDYGFGQFARKLDITIVVEYFDYDHRHGPLPQSEYVDERGFQKLTYRRGKDQLHFEVQVFKQPPLRLAPFIE